MNNRWKKGKTGILPGESRFHNIKMLEQKEYILVGGWYTITKRSINSWKKGMFKKFALQDKRRTSKEIEEELNLD